MKRLHVALAAVMAVVFVWSYIGCYDRFTWLLEVAPILLALPVLAATYRRFPLTDLTYVLVTIHAIINARISWAPRATSGTPRRTWPPAWWGPSAGCCC